MVPDAAIEMIKRFEGYAEALPNGRARAYPDPIKGWDVPTIGWGTTRYPDGSRVKRGDIITPRAAAEYLAFEVERICKPALEKIPTWPQMNDNQKAALYSFAYNLGANFYGGNRFQSITKVCNSPDQWDNSDWIQKQFVKYCNPGTDAEKGLKRRRRAEAELFCKAVA